MKTLSKFFILVFLTSCSSTQVFPVNGLIDQTKKSLSESPKNYLNLSGVDETVPTEVEKDKFYNKLVLNDNYRKYLQSECLLLLHKEQGLNLDRPVFAADPQWNNIENYYYMLVTFQSVKSEALAEETFECDVAINKKKEVTEYQLKKSMLQIQKRGDEI